MEMGVIRRSAVQAVVQMGSVEAERQKGANFGSIRSDFSSR